MPVDLVQRGPFSYDELTVTASQAGASPSAPRDFTLTNAIFDSTIGEVLEVFVNGVKLVGSGLNATGDEFTVDSNISKITIVADSALNSAGDSEVTTLAENDTVLIRRVSNRTAKKVDFAPGSVIREADLDNANTQVFHTAQEAIDIALQGMVLDADGRWNASSGGANRVIKNAATPSSSDPDDYVATKGYVDGQNATTTVASISGQVTTVAGISDDVTTVAGAVKETVAYTLTASGGKFYIAGGEFSSATSNPVLNLQRGSTYTFDYSDSSISSGSHVLGFSSADTNTNNLGAVAYTGSANGITDNTVDKIITFVVPASAPDTLYYYCTAHNAMGNTMNIAEDSIEIVADNIANVNKVGAIDSNVSTVAGIDSNVTTVAGIHGNVTTVANIGTNGADVTTVAGKATEIDTLVNGTDGTSGTSGSTNNLTLIDTVEGALPNINTVATNINSVSNFADTYHPSVDSSDTSRTSSTAAPGSAGSLSTLTEGDLWFDSIDNTLKVYDGSSFNAATSSIATVASQNEFTASDGQGTDSKYFALNHDVGLELVFLNGVRLKRGSDYYCTNSNTSTTPIASGNAATFVRLETVPGSSDILSIMAFGQIANNLAVNTTGGTFTGGVTFEAGTTHNLTSNNTSFTLPTTRGNNNYVLTRDDSVGTGGTAWKETLLTPTISSISPTNIEESDTTQTIVITGGNFDATASAVLIDNNGTTKTPTTSTRNSETQITIVFSGSDVLDNTVPEPLDVKVTQGGSSLFIVLENALTIDAKPVWSSPSAGALTDQTYIEDEAITQVNFVATDPEGQTPTYSVTSGALPTGLSLSSAGALTGTPNVNDTYNSSGVVHNFTVTANDTTGNTTDRAFSITRKWKDGSTSALAAPSGVAIYDLTGTTTNGTFWIKPTAYSGSAIECFVWMENSSFGRGAVLVAAFTDHSGFAMSSNTGGTNESSVKNYHTSVPSSSSTALLNKNFINALVRDSSGNHTFGGVLGNGAGAGYGTFFQVRDTSNNTKGTTGNASFDAFYYYYATGAANNNTQIRINTDARTNVSWNSYSFHNSRSFSFGSWGTYTGGRSASDGTNTYHYMPDDESGGGEWLFRENDDNTPRDGYSSNTVSNAYIW